MLRPAFRKTLSKVYRNYVTSATKKVLVVQPADIAYFISDFYVFTQSVNAKKAELGYVDGEAPKGLDKKIKDSIPSEQAFIAQFNAKYTSSTVRAQVDEHRPLDQSMKDITTNIQQDFEKMMVEMAKNTRIDVDCKLEKYKKFLTKKELNAMYFGDAAGKSYDT